MMIEWVYTCMELTNIRWYHIHVKKKRSDVGPRSTFFDFVLMVYFRNGHSFFFGPLVIFCVTDINFCWSNTTMLWTFRRERSCEYASSRMYERAYAHVWSLFVQHDWSVNMMAFYCNMMAFYCNMMAFYCNMIGQFTWWHFIEHSSVRNRHMYVCIYTVEVHLRLQAHKSITHAIHELWMSQVYVVIPTRFFSSK